MLRRRVEGGASSSTPASATTSRARGDVAGSRPVPRRAAAAGSCTAQRRHGAVHARAHRPRRLEHPTGRWPLAADLRRTPAACSARIERAHWSATAGDPSTSAASIADSVQPVVDAGLADCRSIGPRAQRRGAPRADTRSHAGHVSVRIARPARGRITATLMHHVEPVLRARQSCVERSEQPRPARFARAVSRREPPRRSLAAVAGRQSRRAGVRDARLRPRERSAAGAWPASCARRPRFARAIAVPRASGLRDRPRLPVAVSIAT